MSVFFIIEASSTWKQSDGQVQNLQTLNWTFPGFNAHRFALDPLSSQGAGGNGGAAAKGFEPSVHNLPIVVHLNLRKHIF